MSAFLELSLTPGLGPVLVRRLVDELGSAQQATTASIADLQRIDGIGPNRARSIVAARSAAAAAARQERQRASDLGFRILPCDDPDYPPLLLSIPDPPPILYMRGQFQPRDLNAVAMVGSRNCSFYGREQSERFAALLAGSGVTVVSGGARGIDSSAHRGALSHPLGRTIAVLGSGLDVPYPPENASLFDTIAARGAVLSEFPLGTPPTPENFPRRNRIVSGLSRAVLVVEADERSGALITARQAIDDHNRPVLAIPGRLDNKLSAGPHRLIRDGATLVTCLDDVLEALGPLPENAIAPSLFADPKPTAQPTTQPAPGILTQTQQVLLSHLGIDPAGIDALVERTSLPPQQVLQDLTLLSLKGLVRRLEGQTFARKP